MKLAVLLVLLAACNKAEPPLPTVTLRSPGAEPHRALSYRPSDHSVAHFTFASRPDQTDLALTLDLQRDGAGHRFKITAAKSIGGKEIEDFFLTAEPGMLNSNAQGATSARMPSSSVTFPSIPSLATGFVVPFPTEPIGVGATWFRDETSPYADTPIRYEYTLVSLDRDTAFVRWSAKHGRERMEAEATIDFGDLIPKSATSRQTLDWPDPDSASTQTTTLSR